MKLKACLVFLVLLKITPLFGQEIDTVKLFFAINEYQLSSNNQIRLDALYRAISYYPRVSITGYADFLGDDPKNLVLSVNRAEAVKTYLLCLNKYLVITTEGKGTVPASKKDLQYGDPINRRVDIIIKSKPGVRLIPSPRQVWEKQDAELPPEDIKQFTNKLNSLTIIPAGKSISLDELDFQSGRHFLNPESVYYMKTLAAYLKSNDKLVFEIRGHICCDYNNPDGYDIDTREYGLSVTRAKFIYDYLFKNGIAKKRMRYTGVGSSQPKIYPEVTDRDRSLNRRVEIVIVSK
ncbi:MAG: flagellar motor protein MotD [Mucilaginibacter sp.]|nr:flagellar motor protein MotD [Mucilaginibacter sp.]